MRLDDFVVRSCGVLPASIGGNAAGSTAHKPSGDVVPEPGKLPKGENNNSRTNFAARCSGLQTELQLLVQSRRHSEGSGNYGREKLTTETCGTSRGLSACLWNSSQQRRDFKSASTINSKIIDLVMFEIYARYRASSTVCHQVLTI